MLLSRPVRRKRRSRIADRSARTALPVEPLEGRLLMAAAGLVAAYGFNEGSGTVAADASGTGNAGAVSGATWGAGKFGSALSFDGVNDSVAAADSGSLDLTTGMTLEAWVRPSALASWRTAILKENAAGLTYALYASDSASRQAAYVNLGAADRGTTAAPALALDAWTHLAATFDGGTLLLYVNGTQAGTLAAAGTLTNGSGPLRIGGNGVWGEYFAGLIDEVRVYNRPLSAAEINTDMNSPVGTAADTTPPTVAAVTPLNGAAGVATGVNVTARFSEAMSAASISGATVELRDPSGALVPAAVTFNASTNTVTLDPTASLAASSSYYTARVRGGSAGVKDSAGNPLAADFSWSFTTGTPAFQETTVFGGLTQPTVVRFSPDGRVFVAEKSGLIKVFDNLADTTATVFADLRTQVHNFWDRGLLGMALHPNFPATPYVYVLYTYDGDVGQNNAPKYGTAGATTDPGPDATGVGAWVSGRLSRLTASGNVMTGSEQVLVHDWAQQFPSHSIGSLQFGPDGALYASGGDGASFNYTDYGQTGNPFGDPGGPAGANLTPPTAEGGALRSQDLRTTSDPTGLNGSIIRIDPNTGAALPTNPLFSSGADANAKRIISYGLRNPFRFTVRPGTSELWVGDVGWNTWEEINRVTAPADPAVDNFGWPAYEGGARQDGYDAANLNLIENLYAAGPGAHNAPFYAYNHGAQIVGGTEPTGGSSISGLAFYNGGSYPTAYNGALFFSDYSRNRIYVMYQGVNGDPDPNNRAMFVGPAAGPVHLEIGPGGDLFYVDLNGTIRRISYTASNRAPTAVATATPSSGPSPLTVTFDATGSTDPDAGDTLAYAWDLDDDGAYDDSTAARPTFTYTAGGTHTVRLRVTDRGGLFDTDVVLVSVNNSAPSAVIDAPLASRTWRVGETIAFSGHASDAEDGALAAAKLTWSLVVQHGTAGSPDFHLHPVQDFPGVASGSFVAPDHEYPSRLELRLTATDSGGLSSTTSVLLEPLTVGLTLHTSPEGLTLSFNGSSLATPFTRTVIVGSSNSVSAPSPQTLGGTNYNFSNWSDTGAQSHNLIAPAAAASYTATYTAAPPPPTNGLVAAYGFDEGAGTSAGDASNSGNVGTLSGAAWVTTGKFGKALSFDGVNDWVTVADADSLDLSTGMTLEAWVNPAGLTGYTTVLLKERAGGLAYALYGSDNTSRPPAGYVFRGRDVAAVGTSALALNAWAHLATTYDGAALRLYVNGALVRTTATTGAVAASANALRIGGNSVWGEYFKGLIDEVRVYNRALAQSEIQTDMNTAVGGAAGAAGAAFVSAAMLSTSPEKATSDPAGGATQDVLSAEQPVRRHRNHKARHHRRPRATLSDAKAVRAMRHGAGWFRAALPRG